MGKTSKEFLEKLAEKSVERYKPARNLSDCPVSSTITDRKSNSDPDRASEGNGALNDQLREPVPEYRKSPAERIFSGQNNTWIVLGRDRPGPLESGYGGKAHSQCGAIDIVVGRMSPVPCEVDADGNKIVVDSDFKTDAARIYISQKTDIDKNFNVIGGSHGPSERKSGIGIKADCVRIVGREGIKLVTRTEQVNSRGGPLKSVSGIDIIAGNDDRFLQPMVKGQNLVEAWENFTQKMMELAGMLHTFIKIQSRFNSQVMFHVHPSPFGGIPTLPSESLISSGLNTSIEKFMKSETGILFWKNNLSMWQANYLKPWASVSVGNPGEKNYLLRNTPGSELNDKYILSRYNNVN
jgi:hypothetical protein